jgi:hypothetical protein
MQTRAPDFAEWVVTKKIGSLDNTSSTPGTATTTQSAPAESTQDTITKTHDVIRVVRLDSAQRAWTIWCRGAQEYMIWPDGKSCAGVNPSFGVDYPNPFYIDFSASDFAGFKWISLQNYAGIKTYAGTKCIVFQVVTDNPNSKEIAYVDFENRLPLALQCGGYEYLYKWNPPPHDMLSFPPMVQAVIESSVKAQRRVSQKAVSAY